MFSKIAFILSIISSFSMLLPFYGVYSLCRSTGKKLLNRDIFVFASYIIIITFAQALISIYSFAHLKNLHFFNLFIPIEFGFFLFIVSLLYPELNKKEWIISAIGITFSYFVVGITKAQNDFPKILILIESSVLIPLILNAYIKTIRNNSRTKPYQDLMFKGILIYSLCNLILVGFIQEFTKTTMILHSILNIYANYLFLKSFMNYGRNNGL